MLLGVYQAAQGFFRFAAADAAADAFKPKAISWVLAGGLLSALLGPEIVRATSESVPAAPYAGAYLAMIALNVIGAPGSVFLDIPRPRTRAASRGHGQAARRHRAPARIRRRGAVGDGGRSPR